MSSEHDEKVWVAEAILRHRQKRTELLPSSLFAEHPWDALLHLFIADAAGRRLDGDDLAAKTGASRPVMSRWIKHLGAEGLIDGDGHGEMNVTLVLSHKALHAIEVFLADVQDLGEEFIAAREHRRASGARLR